MILPRRRLAGTGTAARPSRPSAVTRLAVLVALLGPIPVTTAAEEELPDAKPLPTIEVIPLPYDRETA